MEKCVFTDNKAEVYEKRWCDRCYYYDSSACGKYWITLKTYNRLDSLTFEYQDRVNSFARTASETIRLNEMSIIPIWVYENDNEINPKDIEEIKKLDKNIVIKKIKDTQNTPIEHSKKETELIHLIASKLTGKQPFDCVKFCQKDLYKLHIFSLEELVRWLDSLEKEGYLQLDGRNSYMGSGIFLDQLNIRLTSKGWKIAEHTRRTSQQVFVAIAFTDSKRNKLENAPIRNAIKEVCGHLGWKAISVDEEEFNNGIMDQVVALINKSTFVIADLTYQKRGVYYEAGYAYGKGIPVIYIVSKNHLENCHFDVKHLNLIDYKDADDLTKRLKDRIEATVGKFSNNN